MRGAGVEILVGPKLLFAVKNQDDRTWCLSKTWLSHHSLYFKRACDGYLRKTNRVMIDTDPDIFGLFVEFMIRGGYTYRDNLKVYEGIREHVKAWILGNYLEAATFQNLAMRNLHNIYKPRNYNLPMSGIGPEAIEFILEACETDSPLYNFHLDVAATYWSNNDVVLNGGEWTKAWNEIFKKYPSFQSELLTRLSQSGTKIAEVEKYLVKEPVTEDAVPNSPPPAYQQ
jgi:hypothetical protein